MGKKQQRKSLADEVAERARSYTPKTWVDKLAPAAASELLETRSRFQSGGYGDQSSAAIARAIREVAVDEQWKVPDEKELAKWLRTK